MKCTLRQLHLHANNTAFLFRSLHLLTPSSKPWRHTCLSVALGTLNNVMVALPPPLLFFCISLLWSTRFSTSLITSDSAISLGCVSGGGLGVSSGADRVTFARRSGPLSVPEQC